MPRILVVDPIADVLKLLTHNSARTTRSTCLARFTSQSLTLSHSRSEAEVIVARREAIGVAKGEDGEPRHERYNDDSPNFLGVSIRHGAHSARFSGTSKT